MCEQETKEDCKGGILADEMGMGKTIQTVSLITKKLVGRNNPTLIVCTTTSMLQWEAEINRYLRPGTVKIFLYHGKSKITAKSLRGYDIVLTTYRTLEAEYRKELDQLKRACPYCKRKILPELLFSHKEKCPKRPRTTWTYDASGRAHPSAPVYQPSAPSSSSSTYHHQDGAPPTGQSLRKNLFQEENRSVLAGGGSREVRAPSYGSNVSVNSNRQQYRNPGSMETIKDFFTGQAGSRVREDHLVKQEDVNDDHRARRDLVDMLKRLRPKAEQGRDSIDNCYKPTWRTTPYSRPSVGGSSGAVRPSTGPSTGPLRINPSISASLQRTIGGYIASRGIDHAGGFKEEQWMTRDTLVEPSSAAAGSISSSLNQHRYHVLGHGRPSGASIPVKEEAKPMVVRLKPSSPLRECSNLGYIKVENGASWDSDRHEWRSSVGPITQKGLVFSSGLPRPAVTGSSAVLDGPTAPVSRKMYSPLVKRGGLPGRHLDESPLLGLGKRIKAEEMAGNKENVDDNAWSVTGPVRSYQKPSPQCSPLPKFSTANMSSSEVGWKGATMGMPRSCGQDMGGARRKAAEIVRRAVKPRRVRLAQAAVEDSSDETGGALLGSPQVSMIVLSFQGLTGRTWRPDCAVQGYCMVCAGRE